jgi:hypothetical protein
MGMFACRLAPFVEASMSFLTLAILCFPTVSADTSNPAVVINEIMYHAPDDLDKLQFIEVHNAGDAAVDLSGWKLARSIQFEFPAGTKIEPNGFLVICRDADLFKKHYGIDPDATFRGDLDNNGGRVEIVNATGTVVDSVRYRSRPPWPVAPDGMSSSLERICPVASAGIPENWAPSPLPKGPPKPGGTPASRNANYAERLPPIVSDLKFTPKHPAPGQDIVVDVEVKPAKAMQKVELLWRTAGTNSETKETAIVMSPENSERFSGTIPGQKSGRIVRFRIRARDEAGAERHFPSEHELRPAVSLFVHEPFVASAIPQGYLMQIGGFPPLGSSRFRAPSPDPPPRGNAAYVHVDAQTGKPELFDYINIIPRGGGRKIRFHKDHLLDGMSTINLVFEGSERFVLAEPLAYEVYKKCQVAAPRHEFVRTHLDGKPIGYQLLIEQPNKAFLRRNDVRTDGHLYKLIWYGRGLVGQHEKKTRVHEGHDDLVKIVADLNKSTGDEQFNIIKRHFDVEQVASYFAVNMVLSHWDGFFNNYFAYHDVHGTGKWTMYPWDQDKTWGFHDGIHGHEVFVDMPITFGMKGDKPPAPGRGLAGFFGGGPVWWRPAGYFSGPLLANPRFREIYLARVKEILETVYTPEVMLPLIQKLGERLEGEVRFRAEIYRSDPDEAVKEFHRNLDSLREHLARRRAFLLDQKEIKNAGMRN